MAGRAAAPVRRRPGTHAGSGQAQPSLGPLPDDAESTIAMLESAAIARGAKALTGEQLEAARLTNDLLRRYLDDAFLPAAADLARSFHRQLVRACPNAHMVQMLDAQVIGRTACAATSISHAAIERAADEHDELLEMVRGGAPLGLIERFARRHTGGPHTCCG